MKSSVELSVLIILSILGCYYLLDLLHKAACLLMSKNVDSSENMIARKMSNAYAREDVGSIKKTEIEGVFSRLASISNPHLSYEKRKALLETAVQWSRKHDYPTKKKQIDLLQKAIPFQHNPGFLAELTKYQSELYERVEKNEGKTTSQNLDMDGTFSFHSSIPMLLTVVFWGLYFFRTKIIDDIIWVAQIFILLLGIVGMFVLVSNLMSSTTTIFRLLTSVIICLTYFYVYSYVFHSNIMTKTQDNGDYQLDYQLWLTYTSLQSSDKLCGERMEITSKPNRYPRIVMKNDDKILKIFDKDCLPLSWPVESTISDPSYASLYFVAPKDEMILWAYAATQIEVQSEVSGFVPQKENLLIKIESPLWEGMRRTYNYILGVIVLGIVGDFIKTYFGGRPKIASS